MRYTWLVNLDHADKQAIVEIQRGTFICRMVEHGLMGENERLWFYLPHIPHLPLD